MGAKRWWVMAAALGCSLALSSNDSVAADPENCLLCHRYVGLGRIADDGRLRLFHVSPDYYDDQLGPHARLKCTDCHPRVEVGVIPHQPVSKVDCTSACHLDSPDRPARQFAHDRIDHLLERSAHGPEVMATCNDLLGEPLSDGQSTCLLCHAEPTFDRAGLDFKPTGTRRCDLCHTEELPKDTDFALRHVVARYFPQRTHAQLARGCALCHSNATIRRHYQLPDSVASYLASFHGKAMLLGTETTAGCLDCHAGELQNVHLMLPRDDAASSVHVGKLADTCRSADCHPAAGTLVTAAAVHLELSPTRLPLPAGAPATSATANRGNARSLLSVEYGIALLFVLLILCTFGPSALLQILELVQLVVGRHSRHHNERVEQARALMATSSGRAALVRFTVHQRVQHWILFASFSLLVLTGFPIKFADRSGSAWLIDVMGGLTVARHVHRYAGLVLIVGAFYHAAYVCWVFGRRLRREGKGWLETTLGMPLVVNVADLREFFHLLGYLLFLRPTRPLPGRFALKEKFEYFGVFWGCALLGVTGVLMWGNSWTTHYVSGRMLTIASLVHTMEALLALLHVGLFHMIGVVFSPHVFPMSKAMFTGDTPVEELADAHGGMIASARAELFSEPDDG